MTVTSKDIKQWDGLVKRVVAKYMPVLNERTDVDFDDVFQMGRLGLVRALRDYDENKGNFISYASKAIARSILRELKSSNKSKDDVNLEIDMEDIKSIEDLDNRIDFEVALNNLKASDYIKGILRMRYDGYSCNEIGRKLGKSYQNINAIINRYKDKLL